MLNYQSDWGFLNAVRLYDQGAPNRDGKNIVRYFRENLGFEVDPHAHPNEGPPFYNLADVAWHIEQLGVQPSGTVGGFIAWPTQKSDYSTLLNPILANQQDLPMARRNPLGRIDERSHWRTAIRSLRDLATSQRKADSSAFLDRAVANDRWIWSPAARGPGHEFRSWNRLHHLIQLQRDKKLDPRKMYTCTVFIGQRWLLKWPRLVDEFRDHIRLANETGKVRWVGIKQAIDIWESQYQGKPSIEKDPDTVGGRWRQTGNSLTRAPSTSTSSITASGDRK